MTRATTATLLTLLLSSSTVTAQIDESATVTAPGFHSMTLPGSGRRYTLVIPDGYSGEQPTPLILSLHFGGQVTPFYGRGLVQALIEPALRDLGAIIVAPDSAAGNWANPTSEQHVLELLDYIGAQYDIDANRTLLTGFSMGGAGTWYLAPRHPERFKAAVAIAGRPQDDSASLEWETPLYLIHSTADEVVPLASTQAAAEQLRQQGAQIEIVVIDEISHYETPRYEPHVRAAIPWIRQAWAE